MKRLQQLIFIICAGVLTTRYAPAQTINAIDSKGTLLPINWTLNGSDIHNNNTGNVGIGTPTPNNLLEIQQGTAGNSGLRFTNLLSAALLGTNADGDVVETIPSLGTITTTTYLGYDSGGNLVFGPPNALWSLTGNSDATASNFLGTINDVKLALASNNTTMLEVGRRQTLGLYDGSGTGLFPYNQANASMVHIRGTGGVSALQFESSGASFYKPILFTDADGNFVMRGSSAGTDFFELGSSGASNNGSLLFSIGDDGDEPMIFRKYNYTTQSYIEMLRLQGTGLNSNVRAGINVGGSTPNSTLQVNGSLATAIITTTGNLTLDESHHTIIIDGPHGISFPAAGANLGRSYIIKNPTDITIFTLPYRDLNGNTTNLIPPRTTISVQSDGTNWQQLSLDRITYEKIVIWAEESGTLGNNSGQWSFGNGDSGFIGLPLPEEWEAYAVSFHADNTAGTGNSTVLAVGDISSNSTFSELFRFTASGGTDDNLTYTEILTSPVSISSGTTLGFRTITESGTINSARVAVWLRRIP